MRRVLRASLVGALTLTLCVDPATACHFLRSRWGGGGGYGWGGNYCPAPVDYAGPCSGVVISGDGCCSYDGYAAEAYVDSCCDSGAIIESGEPIYQDSRPAPLEPTPSESSTFKPSDEERPSLPADPMPERPADDELVAPPSQPAAPATTQEVPPPADTPVTPPSDADDDLFGPIDEPAAPPSATTPSTPPPSTPQTPATPPQTPPAAADPMDDFFSDEPAQPAGAGALPDQPATPPADSTPPASTPATPPSEPADDDLFGDLSSEPAPSQPATPPATPGADAETGDADFGGFDINEDPAPPPADAAPAETEEESAEEVDMFDFGAVLREPGGFASSEVRTWVDNTGNYSCNGRLIRFVDGQVRLLKDNGRTTTLPLYRLSENDLEFVYRQASAKQAEVIGHTAAVAVTPLLAN